MASGGVVIASSGANTGAVDEVVAEVSTRSTHSGLLLTCPDIG